MEGILDNNFVVKYKNNKHGFIKSDKALMYDDRLSDETKIAILKIIGYHDDPKKFGDNWPKKRFSAYWGTGRYKTNKIYKEAEAAGYCYHVVVYPTVRSKDGTLNNRIKHVYYWYESPELNPHYKKEADMITNKNTVEVLQKHLEKEPIVEEVIEEKETPDNVLMEQLKASCFCNLVERTYPKVDVKPTLRNKINEERTNGLWDNTEDAPVEPFINACYDIIVRAVAYNNDKAFEAFRHSTAGELVAEVNKKAIRTAYNKFDIFQKEKSGLALINSGSVQAGKILLMSFAMVIHNFVKLNFTSGKMPEYKELLGLFKTLSEHPELIFLKNNTKDYKTLDLLFKANQAKYNQRT